MDISFLLNPEERTVNEYMEDVREATYRYASEAVAPAPEMSTSQAQGISQALSSSYRRLSLSASPRAVSTNESAAGRVSKRNAARRHSVDPSSTTDQETLIHENGATIESTNEDINVKTSPYIALQVPVAAQLLNLSGEADFDDATDAAAYKKAFEVTLANSVRQAKAEKPRHHVWATKDTDRVKRHFERTYFQTYCEQKATHGDRKHFICHSQTLTGTPCPYTQQYGPIDQGSRAVVSNYFGRNKTNFQQLGKKFQPLYCRKCYQHVRYNAKTPLSYARTKLQLILLQLEYIEVRNPGILYTIQINGQMQQRCYAFLDMAYTLRDEDDAFDKAAATIDGKPLRRATRKTSEDGDENDEPEDSEVEDDEGMNDVAAHAARPKSRTVSGAANSRSAAKAALKLTDESSTPVIFAMELKRRFCSIGHTKRKRDVEEAVHFIWEKLQDGTITVIPPIEFLFPVCDPAETEEGNAAGGLTANVAKTPITGQDKGRHGAKSSSPNNSPTVPRSSGHAESEERPAPDRREEIPTRNEGARRRRTSTKRSIGDAAEIDDADVQISQPSRRRKKG